MMDVIYSLVSYWSYSSVFLQQSFPYYTENHRAVMISLMLKCMSIKLQHKKPIILFDTHVILQITTLYSFKLLYH